MDTVILARHGESEFSQHGLVNGLAETRCDLTETGVEQARALGRALASRELELVVTSGFERARRTAEIATVGRELPWLALAELGDIAVGVFEGGSLDEYRTWAHSHDPQERPPGGGESRAEVAARFARGYRTVLDRPERVALVVSHGLAIRYALQAADGHDPTPVADPIPYARPFELAAEQLRAAVERLEAWAADPRW
jgi:broad specificity phosphatase PhoE